MPSVPQFADRSGAQPSSSTGFGHVRQIDYSNAVLLRRRNMKAKTALTIISVIAAFGVVTVPAGAKSIWDQLNETAPKTIWDDIRDTSPVRAPEEDRTDLTGE